MLVIDLTTLGMLIPIAAIALITTATSIRFKVSTFIPNIALSPSISRFSAVAWQTNGTRKRSLA